MPTYEYTCEACGKNWEIEQRISEPKLTDCPTCGEPKAKRLISGGTFMLKGGGWYADGYGNSKPAAKGGDGKPAESSKSDGSKSDSGSASTPASTPAASAPSSGSPSSGSTPSGSGSSSSSSSG